MCACRRGNCSAEGESIINWRQRCSGFYYRNEMKVCGYFFSSLQVIYIMVSRASRYAIDKSLRGLPHQCRAEYNERKSLLPTNPAASLHYFSHQSQTVFASHGFMYIPIRTPEKIPKFRINFPSAIESRTAELESNFSFSRFAHVYTLDFYAHRERDRSSLPPPSGLRLY